STRAHRRDDLLQCGGQLVRQSGIRTRHLDPDFVLEGGELVEGGGGVAALEGPLGGVETGQQWLRVFRPKIRLFNLNYKLCKQHRRGENKFVSAHIDCAARNPSVTIKIGG